MINWQRIFAFVTASIVFGLGIILLSHSFIKYVARPDAAGWAFLFGFGLIFLNLNLVINRRFIMKALDAQWVSYLMALLMVTPTVFWVYTKDVGLGEAQLLFVLTVIFSAFLGCYFGIRRGTVKRAQYIEQMREDDQDLPQSLKRPHDDLNPN